MILELARIMLRSNHIRSDDAAVLYGIIAEIEGDNDGAMRQSVTGAEGDD